MGTKTGKRRWMPSGSFTDWNFNRVMVKRALEISIRQPVVGSRLEAQVSGMGLPKGYELRFSGVKAEFNFSGSHTVGKMK